LPAALYTFVPVIAGAILRSEDEDEHELEDKPDAFPRAPTKNLCAKVFAFFEATRHAGAVIQPLALVIYDRLMPGSQLVNRLQDLNYRVLALNELNRLAATAQRESPLLLVLDLTVPGDVCGAIATLRSTPATAHLPVIGFAPENAKNLLPAAQAAGANLAVTETALLNYLAQLIDQALNLD
jgi:CheY-like chemotaxis protein